MWRRRLAVHLDEKQNPRFPKMLLVGDYELGDVVAAHAVDRSGRARSYRIGIAARMLGGHGDGPIGTAHDSALVVKGIGAAKIKHEARVL